MDFTKTKPQTDKIQYIHTSWNKQINILLKQITVQQGARAHTLAHSKKSTLCEEWDFEMTLTSFAEYYSALHRRYFSSHFTHKPDASGGAPQTGRCRQRHTDIKTQMETTTGRQTSLFRREPNEEKM